MGRRKGRLRKRNLAIGAGVLVLIFVMITSFPFITNAITGGDESTEFAFAFPEIDNSVLTDLVPAVLIGGQETNVKITAVDCFFKFSLIAKDTSGNVIESRESGFSGSMNPFTTFSIATVAQTTPSGETVIGGRTIDRYEITPKMRCDRDIINPDNQKFESAIAVLPSDIKLTTTVIQPDGSAKNLADRTLRIQSIGADNNCNAFDTNTWVIGVGAQIIPIINLPLSLGQQGVLKDNQEIEFKGTLGATKCANEFFQVPASAVNNLAKPQLQTYNTEVIFSMTGNLNMNYLFIPEDKTQALPLSGLSKTVRINVDRIQDVPASEFPQSIVLLSATTSGGKCLAGDCGSIKNLNPDVSQDRLVHIIAELDDFQGVNVEGSPTLTLKKVIGGSTVGGVTGGNPKLMSFAGNDRFTASMTLPSSIADAHYVFQVTSQTRSNVGVGSISVVTPPPDAPEIPTCDGDEILDANDMCVPKPTETPTDPTCGSGQTLSNGQCVDVFCPDGTPATDGCTIKPVLGGQCLEGQIEELDGTCTNPLCGTGTTYDQSSQRCVTIVCDLGQEFDTNLKQCVTPPSGTTACKLNEVRQGGVCVPVSEAFEEGEGNVLNIRQELRYELLTSDQSGDNTPIQFGKIPDDESLFAGLTQLQFVTENERGKLVKFDILKVNSFLILPQTLGSVNIPTDSVKLNQNLKLYHNNVILQSGITKNPTEPALAVNIPLGTFGQTNTGIGGGFFALGNMVISTSEILSAVEGLTTGITLEEGDRISAMYVVDGTFDLTSGVGDEQKTFEGKIGQMRYWTNLIYTDKVLAGDECIGLSEKPLLRCTFEATGNNPLADVCTELSNEELEQRGVDITDEEAVAKENFDDCLDSIDDRTIGAIQNSICEDSDKLQGMVDLTNTGDKSTEEILADLKSAFGCECKLNEKLVNGQCVMKDPSEITTFVCPAGTENKEGVEIASTLDDCQEKDVCKKAGIEGGTLEANTDGTFKCVAPTVINTETGEPQCQTGTERNPETGLCEYPVEKENTSSVDGINALFAGLTEFLNAFTNTNDPSVTTTGSNGETNKGGACDNLFSAECLGQFFGEDEPEDVTIDNIIPPSLQVGGSGTVTLVLIFVIIIAVLIVGVIIRRRRG